MSLNCPKRTKKVFGLFSIKEKHLFYLTNAFYQLENRDMFDIIKTCKDCGQKEVLEMNKETLGEVILKYPNAFSFSLIGLLKSLIL